MTAGIEPTGSFFNGKIVAREFQGSLADTRRDSDAQRDMPVIERQHLLRALTATERPIEFAMPRPRMARVPGTNAAPHVEREEVDWTFVF